MSNALSIASLDRVQFVAPGDNVRIDVGIDNETVCLTQAPIAELSGRKQQAISHHVRKVFFEGELERGSNTQKISTAQSNMQKHCCPVYFGVDRSRSLIGWLFP